jgi:hypothetical protein
MHSSSHTFYLPQPEYLYCAHTYFTYLLNVRADINKISGRKEGPLSPPICMVKWAMVPYTVYCMYGIDTCYGRGCIKEKRWSRK